MCSGRLQYRPKQDFDEPAGNNTRDSFVKLDFSSTDRSNGRGNINPSVSNDRFHASTPSRSKSAQGHKVTNLLVGGIDMASLQRSDLVSVVQRNSGQVQALLVALRVKNASNGILR
jgi:conjugal transfer/entry exclusion protein